MNFYSIIVDNKIIGVASSNDFKILQRKPRVFLPASEENGQYILWRDQFYRDYWMAPTVDATRFIQAEVITITENEYNNLLAAFIENEQVEEDIAAELSAREEELSVNVEEIAVSNANPVLEAVRELKIKTLRSECQKQIENGFDLNNEHFSLTIQDQLNLAMVSEMIRNGETEIPYHADNDLSRFYSVAEIQEIIQAATRHRIYHINYFNSLKNYVNSLSTIESIAAITYGTEIPETYQTSVFKTLDF